MSSFELDMTKFIDKVTGMGGQVDQVVRKVVLDVGSSVVLKTPVDTGRARANWQYGVDVRPAGELDATDRSGSATISSFAAAVPEAAARVTHWFSNNLPYIEALERGHSKQAPAGMVGITLVEYQDYISRAVGEVRK